MRFKRLLALLLAAALALSLLAGCGGGKNQSLSQMLLNLLDGQYQNVSMEIDSDLEAKLRQAISESETDEELRAALEQLLGGGISFQRLGSGQQGDSAWTLILYPGTDPNAAARSVYLDLDKVFAALPDDGVYSSGFAMAEMENGYAILVKATVDKAGSRDDDDDEPEEPKGPGYTVDDDGNYTVNTDDGLQNLFADNLTSDFAGKTITLDKNLAYIVDTTNRPLAETFKGELHGNGATVTITGGIQGLFNEIDTDGKVLNVDIEVNGTISVSKVDDSVANVGAVAGTNNGTIQNCDVTGSTIQGDNYNDNVGGIVGDNYGTIQGCSAAVTVKDGKNTGGIAGSNKGTITNCCSTGTVTSDNSNRNTGGVVGSNEGATITACYSTGDITSSGEYSSNTGGVAGTNMYKSDSGEGQIIACYSTGKVSGTTVGGVVGWNSTSSAVIACYHADGEVSGSFAGGVVGQNGSPELSGQITACYWENNQEQGTGSGSTAGTAKVEDGNWTEAVTAMNTALSGEGWQYELGALPTLTQK